MGRLGRGKIRFSDRSPREIAQDRKQSVVHLRQKFPLINYGFFTASCGAEKTSRTEIVEYSTRCYVAFCAAAGLE